MPNVSTLIWFVQVIYLQCCPKQLQLSNSTEVTGLEVGKSAENCANPNKRQDFYFY